MNPQATVGAIYEAFGRGDMPGIVGHVRDDAKWEHWEDNHAQSKGVPYLKSGVGKRGVGDFLASLAAIEIHDFRVLGLLSSANKVCAEIAIEFTVRATGKRVRDEELHLWTLDEAGQVVAFRHYVDTAKHVEANEV